MLMISPSPTNARENFSGHLPNTALVLGFVRSDSFAVLQILCILSDLIKSHNEKGFMGAK